MKWNVNLGTKIQLQGSDIEDVEKFVYLGATVTSSSGQDKSARLGKAQAVFYNLREHLEEQSTKHKHQAEEFKSSVLMVAKRGE